MHNDCTMYYGIKYVLSPKSRKDLKVEVEWNIKIIFFIHKLGVNLLRSPEHFVKQSQRI